MKNKGNNGAIFVKHDTHPEYGVGTIEKFEYDVFDELWMAWVKFEASDWRQHVYVSNLSLV